MESLAEFFERLKDLDPQHRGKVFEEFLGLMLTEEKIHHVLSYRPLGEEIDGAFWWNTHTFLLEAKWHKDPIPASAIYAFKGKVDGKFSGTRGIFISMSGYSEDCIKAIIHGKDLNILLFDRSDIECIIGKGSEIRVDFTTILTEKIFAAGRTGDVYLTWRELENVRTNIENIPKALNGRKESSPVFIYCEGDLDKAIFASLLQYMSTNYRTPLEQVHVVSANGKLSIPALIKLTTMGISDNGAILVVLDADTTTNQDKRLIVRTIRQSLQLRNWKYCVVVADPYLEAWVGQPKFTTKSGVNFNTWLSELIRIVYTTNWDLQSNQISEIKSTISFLNEALNPDKNL